MTIELFREDAYKKKCKAKVVAVNGNQVELDQTIFYPAGGGQPGDMGIMQTIGGKLMSVVDCYKDKGTGAHLHILADGAEKPDVGELVSANLNWDRRHKLMRMHTALHLLCSLVDAGVTGGSVGEEKGRLDFDLEESPDKDELTAKLNELVQKNARVGFDWITEEQLEANPELVRTMSVKPPMGQGVVRVIGIEDIDIQPCGGTHVRSTGEIGPLRVGKIEKKGRMNRRINIHFSEE
ncbi:MAG: alanyl-tRNA editing protein [Rhodospirillales bacterium]|nr:alanyl-tRNA editing protein [Rhodospirillales bacterium]